jgi:hypothetical protein
VHHAAHGVDAMGSRRGAAWALRGKARHGWLGGEAEEQGRGLRQGGFRPKWLMEKGNWSSYFRFQF